ncbi:MAG: ATP-binding protein [Anaerolineae bacterium]|nr:ATP-binding protein [Anaerolineae bacterium]
MRVKNSSVKNAYTHAPELSRHLLPGSLQLLVWLFLHPSAWRHHIARINIEGDTLSPDFCLAELHRGHWQHPILRRLLLIGYGIWPLWICASIGLGLWLSGQNGRNSDLHILSCIAEGAAFGIAIGTATGLAANLAIGLLAGLTTGLAVGLALDPVIEGMALSIAVGLAFGMLESGERRSPTYSLTRQVGGVVIGVISSGFAFGLAILIATSVVYGVTFSVMESIAISIACGLRTRSWQRGIGYGLLYGLTSGVIFTLLQTISESVSYSWAEGAIFSILCTLPYAVVRLIVPDWAGTVAGALGGGGWLAVLITVSPEASLWPLFPLGALGVILGLTINWWRPILLYPFTAAWDFLLYKTDENPMSPSYTPHLRWHSAFWDEHQRLPLYGLENYLIHVLEHASGEGQAAMTFLTESPQRWAAQAAQIELDARTLSQCTTLETLSNVHQRLAAGTLNGPVSALLRSFSRLSQDIEAAIHQESIYNQRLALYAIEEKLDGLQRELTRSNERYATRFHPIVVQWRQMVTHHIHALTETVEQRQEIDNPYIIGMPLTAQQEIFVGRTDISARVEQLLLDRRRPPLLLYGQRRMGKTSLLNNLGRLLPSTIVPLFVDLQGPASQASDYAGFCYNLARGMSLSAERQRGLTFPPLSRETLARDPFTYFDEWLDQIEATLGQATALLALDEFEVLENVMANGHFEEEAILGMLRHLIQHRPHFKVLLAGSHTLEAFQRWASYLINIQVIHIGYLKEDETRQLIEHPIKGFPLRYEPDAVSRIVALTHGHPALIQLLCSEIVTLKNDQPPALRRLARMEDVEAAIPEALSRGSFFFADIERNQVDKAGLSILRIVASQGEGIAANLTTLSSLNTKNITAALNALIQRELIEQVEDGYRFQVELIRRWFTA